LFCFHSKAIFDGVAAIAALFAAVAWFVAATHPVGVPGPTGYGGGISEEQKAEGVRILRGAKWNRWAALLTATSALFQFLGWVVSK
jgi:hypothetical protein